MVCLTARGVWERSRQASGRCTHECCQRTCCSSSASREAEPPSVTHWALRNQQVRLCALCFPARYALHYSAVRIHGYTYGVSDMEGTAELTGLPLSLPVSYALYVRMAYQTGRALHAEPTGRFMAGGLAGSFSWSATRTAPSLSAHCVYTSRILQGGACVYYSRPSL